MYDSIIPTADSIPVHWLWFQVLLIVTFFIHMILMNLLLGGSLCREIGEKNFGQHPNPGGTNC
jgi:hypothetical protein